MNAISVQPHDVSELAIAIGRAQALFDHGDLNMALMLSAAAYDQAKTATTYASKVKASQDLIDKARRMQADALKIESACWVQMANVIEEAQAKGQVAKKGRKANVPGMDIFTLDEIGVDRRRLLEARKLRAAVEAEPGFIDRVIEARVSLGMDPSRANLRAAIGTASATKDDRGENFYQTPEVATRTLLALESFSGSVWEPACGHGAISRVLEAHGYDVVLSDLVDRQTRNGDGELQAVGDFLASTPASSNGCDDIVTNPPYGDVLNDFVAHALRVHKPQKMALLLNLNFLCGFEDDDRNFVMDENPPARVYVFKRRLPMMHREGWTGPKASSRMNTAWFVWERQPDGSYGSATLVQRVDWKDFEQADAMEPGELGHAASIHFDENYSRETPRKTLDERLGEVRMDAVAWGARQVAFSRPELRRGIGIRDTVAEALISEFLDRGMVGPADEDGIYTVIAGEVWSR